VEPKWARPCVVIADCTTPKLCLSVGTCKGVHVMPASVRASHEKQANVVCGMCDCTPAQQQECAVSGSESL